MFEFANFEFNCTYLGYKFEVSEVTITFDLIYNGFPLRFSAECLLDSECELRILDVNSRDYGMTFKAALILDLKRYIENTEETYNELAYIANKMTEELEISEE